MTRTLRLCCIAPYVPYEGIDHAGGDYLHNYLGAVTELGWHVTLLCPDSMDNREAVSKAPPGIRVILGPGQPASRLTRIASTLSSGFPGPSPDKWWRSLDSAARNALDQADVVELHFGDVIRLAELLRQKLPQRVITATCHDVLTQSAERARHAPRYKTRIWARIVQRRYRAMERRCLNSCDTAFVFNPRNESILRNLGVRTPIELVFPVIHPGPDNLAPDPDAKRLLFVAALWRRENAEAAAWFLDQVWPFVRAAEPSAKVRIAGSRPPTWLTNRASTCVEVTGYVPDLAMAYQNVSLVVAPILRGAGVKFKVVQALAFGYPIVCTTVAAEGVNELLQQSVIAPSDTPNDFASAIIMALETIHDATRLARRRGLTVRERLDFKARVREILAEYEKAVESRRVR